MCFSFIRFQIIRLLKSGIITFLFLLIITGSDIHAQYFGRNRPSYRNFDYQLYETPNFNIYHYFEGDTTINKIANTYEKWYLRHQRLFKDTFDRRNPILIYENHPDFQQTTAVRGGIGIGTQGVTEALRRRVAMPVLMTNAQTDHVIGHELVHVFQFRAMFDRDTLGLSSISNLPLWLVEGMAEYFSIGSVDAHTAMIMRDAVHKDDFPSLEDMTRDMRQYNPYRFGHSFVTFFGRTWGDSLIAPLFRETSRFGYQRAISRVVGLNAKTVSNMWKSSMITHYEELLKDTTRHNTVGTPLITDANGGYLNMAPSLSPDGKYLAFFSEKDLLSLDLFLADTETGNIIRKLTSSARNADIDGFNFFESIATWSPDSDKIAYVIVKKGRNKIVISDIGRLRRTEEISIKDIRALNNPTWSPDGKSFVFSGLVNGKHDLFMYKLKSKEIINLTNDDYSYTLPAWSSDGKFLTFSTDKPQSSQQYGNPNFYFNIGIMDMTSPDYNIKVFDIFPAADNINPLFAKENTGLYFLSNSDGYRNLYYYSFEDGNVFRMTDFYTGISGITHLSPAISVSSQTGAILYTHYQKGKYFIHKASHDDFEPVEVDPLKTDFTAATLPPFMPIERGVVDNLIKSEPEVMIIPTDSFAIRPYRPEFELTYIGQSGGVGVSTSRYGTGMSGAVQMLFSDITGENQLFGAVAINGEIYDFGGQVGYFNQERRINWGAQASHIPYPYAYIRFLRDSLTDGTPVDNMQYIIERIFEDEIGVFAYYPFSVSRRIEVGASTAWYYFRRDAYDNYYIPQTNIRLGGGQRNRLDAPDGFNLQRLNIAFVEDNTYFGMASPMAGRRYRIGAEKTFGRADMYSVTLDYRRYVNIMPFTIAFRSIHYGRYGREPDDLFRPQFLGYMGYIRGYDFNSLYRMQNELPSDLDFNQFVNQLIGNRIVLSGLELRLPFTGPERIALISSRMFFTELNVFLDAGVAWNQGTSVTFDPSKITESEIRIVDGNEERFFKHRFPVFSTGVSLRINLFGALVLEPFYAFPFQADGIKAGVAGLNFFPGW